MWVGVAYPGDWKRLPLFVLQVLLDVDEGVEEDGRHFGGFEVRQEDLVCEKETGRR